MSPARASSFRVLAIGVAIGVAMALGHSAAALADLTITQAGPSGVKPGAAAVYTIVVANTGPGSLPDVTVDDPTPAGLPLPSVSGDCAALPCNFATLAAGDSKTVTASFSVPLAYAGPNPIVNIASAHSGSGGPVAATASTAVTRVAGFATLPPCRIADTRLTTGVPIGGPSLNAGEVRTLNVRELCGLPGNAIAISYNLTVTGPTADGNLSVFAGGGAVPPSSAINYVFGQTRANNGIAPLAGDGSLGVQCAQAAGKTDVILDVNGYFASTDAVTTPLGQNVHIRPAPEVALTFDNVTQAGVTSALVLDFADNRTGAVDQDLKLFFPVGSAERTLVPSIIVPSFIKPLGQGGAGGTPTFVLSLIDTTAAFTRTAEFHGFEDFRLAWNPPCVVASDPTQEPRTFYGRDPAEPALVEETGFGGPVFVDISSGCGSNKGSGWNFSLYLTAKDTRTPHDIALYMLNQTQSALSALSASINPTVGTQLGNQVTAALATLDTNAAGSADDMAAFFGIVDGNPTAFDNTTRNVSGEMVGRASSARYVIRKLIPSGTITEFPTNPLTATSPYGITAGPDGNLWIAGGGNSAILRVTTGGAITVFPYNGPGVPYGITAGPDGNLWFTEVNHSNLVGRVTTAGVVTEFPLASPPNGTDMNGIAAGSDGNLWFTEASSGGIGRITTNGVVTEFNILGLTGYTAGLVRGICLGPDGNLWFTEYGGTTGQTTYDGLIGRITPGGVITQFPFVGQAPFPGRQPEQIAAGPDGNLWFTEFTGNKIGRITPAGVITEFPVPTTGIHLEGITSGPDGNLWFTEYDGNACCAAGKIGRITTAGVVTEFAVSAGANPWGITAGPDGNIWYTGYSNGDPPPRSRIGRITP
jgi:uncharacterized repeat protein (TIGR01451 family)